MSQRQTTTSAHNRVVVVVVVVACRIIDGAGSLLPFIDHLILDVKELSDVELALSMDTS